MLGLLSSLSLYYLIESEQESGSIDRPDAVLIPKVEHGDQALVIE